MTDIFTRAHADAILAQLPPDIPADVQRVLVFTVDERGAKVAAVVKRGTLGLWKWDLQAAGHYDWSGDAGDAGGALQFVIMK